MVVVLLLFLLSLFAFISETHGLDNGVGLKPILGWSTWCTGGECGRDVCTEAEIRDIADTMVANGLRDLGWVWLSLDDCWGGPRASDGSYQADPNRFPSGIQVLADYVHARGFKLGVYTDAGLATCSSGGRPYAIPGSYGHYEQDALTFAKWGVDWLKMDWCNTVLANGTQLDPFVQYPLMSAALNATGRPIYFSACEWGVDAPWEWMAPYANDWRATNDHHDSWNGSATQNGNGGTALIIEQAADLASFAGPGHWNYYDFIYTGGQGCASNAPGSHCPGQTDTEYISEISLWTITASPLIFATDPRNLTQIQMTALFNTELLAIHQDELARAGGRVGFSKCTNQVFDMQCQIWARPLVNGDYAIALFNSGLTDARITVDWIMIDESWANNNNNVSLRDVWLHTNLGSFQTSYTTTVSR